MKKTTNQTFLLLLLALVFAIKTKAQSMQFTYDNGKVVNYKLSDVRKITFDADVMNLQLLDGTIYSCNVSIIESNQYDKTALKVDELLNNGNSWMASVFPNPTMNTLNISYNITQSDEVSVSVYDLGGKVLIEKHYGKQSQGSHQHELDMTELPNGSYMIKLQGGRNSIIKKVIKQ